MWRAFYVWADDEVGWLYRTLADPVWRITVGELADVTAETITHGKVPESSQLFLFREMARLDPPAVLFDTYGRAVEIPAGVSLDRVTLQANR